MRKLVYSLLVLLFTAFIFYNSSVPAVTSNNASYFLAGFAARVGELLQVHMSLPEWNHVIRKLGHFFEFMLLGSLWIGALTAYGTGRHTATGYVLFFCLLTAVADEYLQLFIPGRSGRIQDILLDFSGAFVAWLSWRVWQWSH